MYNLSVAKTVEGAKAPLNASASVERSGTFFYMVTIKCNHMKYTSRSDIEAQFNTLLNKLPLVDTSEYHAWEMDKRDRWHYHAIVALSREPWIKGVQVPNWTIHMQRFPEEDYSNIVKYLKKTQQDENILEQLDIESQIAYHPNFGFE